MNLRDIELAYNRIRGFINQTPVLTSNTLEKLANAKTGGTANYKFYFKCENLQKTGAFKVRTTDTCMFGLMTIFRIHLR